MWRTVREKKKVGQLFKNFLLHSDRGFPFHHTTIQHVRTEEEDEGDEDEEESESDEEPDLNYLTRELGSVSQYY